MIPPYVCGYWNNDKSSVYIKENTMKAEIVPVPMPIHEVRITMSMEDAKLLRRLTSKNVSVPVTTTFGGEASNIKAVMDSINEKLNRLEL